MTYYCSQPSVLKSSRAFQGKPAYASGGWVLISSVRWEPKGGFAFKQAKITATKEHRSLIQKEQGDCRVTSIETETTFGVHHPRRVLKDLKTGILFEVSSSEIQRLDYWNFWKYRKKQVIYSLLNLFFYYAANSKFSEIFYGLDLVPTYPFSRIHR